MKFQKTLLALSVIYYIVNAYLLSQVYGGEGGSGLGPYITLLIFQGVSLIIIGALAMFNNKEWLNLEYGSSSKLLLLSYLVIPLITYFLIH